MKPLIALSGAVLTAALGYLLLWPVELDPAVWEAPKAPSRDGVYAGNEGLEKARVVAIPHGAGPEDVAVDASGRVYLGLLDGRILRHAADSNTFENFSNTGGRPLGLGFAPGGDLIVADAFKGLLRVDPTGAITILATEADGTAFRFVDDVDIGPDGLIYFSDASWKYGLHDYRLDLLENKPYGRLLVHDPRSGDTQTLLDDLYFANGVAVDPKGRFVLVNETWRYRVLRYWLKGPDRGRHEVLIDNLPGFPDGISSGRGGVFWVALASPRNALVDASSSRRWLRKAIFRLPRALQPDVQRYGYILGINERGDVVANLQDPQGRFAPITSVEEWRERLYLGSLSEGAYAIFDL